MSHFQEKGATPAGTLPLGWDEGPPAERPIGFAPHASTRRQCEPSPLCYRGEGHLITFGPTGSGKTRGCAIPALLSHTGPAIVVDVKGELYRTTARYRRELGQTVYRVDPWGQVGGDTDALNPLDLMWLKGADPEEEANSLSRLLAGPDSFERDKFWEHTATALNAGLIAYLATSAEPENRRLSHLRELMAGDLPATLLRLLEHGSIDSRLAREEMSIFLQHPATNTRPGIQSSAQQHFRILGTDAVRRAMDQSTVPLQAVIDGAPLTLYLIVPPHKLHSHGGILRVWLGMLLQAISRRRRRGQQRTLFLVDEAASLGPMEPLKQAITLLRGYGAQVWTFWQDASQLMRLYPRDWPTIINNAGVVQLLPPRNLRMADDYAAMVGGLDPEALLELPADAQVLLTDDHRRAGIYRQCDYLHDPRFAGRYDGNPLFGDDPPPGTLEQAA